MLTLKLISQSVFFQDKELPNVFSFPNNSRARKYETFPKKGKGAEGQNCVEFTGVPYL